MRSSRSAEMVIVTALLESLSSTKNLERLGTIVTDNYRSRLEAL
jgi:hypothetical protein